MAKTKCPHVTVKCQSEGVKRLGLALGVVGAIPGLVFFFGGLVELAIGRLDQSLLLLSAVVAVFGFAIPWALVHTIAWIVRGFRVDRNYER